MQSPYFPCQYYAIVGTVTEGWEFRDQTVHFKLDMYGNIFNPYVIWGMENCVSVIVTQYELEQMDCLNI